MNSRPINAKVPWGAAGAAGGSMIGAAIADLLTTWLRSAIGVGLTEGNVTSIEILVVAIVAYAGSFATGYVKESGFTEAEARAETKHIKDSK